MQNVLLDYGLEGYGLYWYCIELIAGKVDAENLTFELEHNARVIAKNTGTSEQKINEMMNYFVDLGLFECSGNVISCMKMARRLDKSMTSNPLMRSLIEKVKSKSDYVMTNPDYVMQDKIRLDKNRINNMSSSDDDLSMSEQEKKPISKSKFSFDRKLVMDTWNCKAEKHGLPSIRSVTDSTEKGLVRLYKSYLKQCSQLKKEPKAMDEIINGYIEYGYQPTKWAMGDNPEGKKFGIATALTQQKIDEILGAD